PSCRSTLECGCGRCQARGLAPAAAEQRARRVEIAVPSPFRSTRRVRRPPRRELRGPSTNDVPEPDRFGKQGVSLPKRVFQARSEHLAEDAVEIVRDLTRQEGAIPMREAPT